MNNMVNSSNGGKRDFPVLFFLFFLLTHKTLVSILRALPDAAINIYTIYNTLHNFAYLHEFSLLLASICASS